VLPVLATLFICAPLGLVRPMTISAAMMSPIANAASRLD